MVTIVTLNTLMIVKTARDASFYHAKSYCKQHPLTFSAQQIKTYSTIGGTPFLDNQYTVFGEVVEGLDVVERIQQAKTNRSDRPINDISMTMEII